MSEQSKVRSASVTFTEAEANNLMEILNVATKAGGMVVAKEAIFFWSKFSKAFDLKKVPGVVESTKQSEKKVNPKK